MWFGAKIRFLEVNSNLFGIKILSSQSLTLLIKRDSLQSDITIDITYRNDIKIPLSTKLEV